MSTREERSNLRREAERLVQNYYKKSDEQMNSIERERVIEELQIHQAELEIQNEELRRVQLELENEKEKYRTLYDFAPTGYLTLDASGSILQANLYACVALNVERAFLINQPLFRFFQPQDRSTIENHCLRAASDQCKQSCELVSGNDRKYYRLESVPAFNAEGTQCLRSVLIDITELHEANATLEASDRRKEDFLAILAHELRNPLAAVTNGLAILDRVPDTAQRDWAMSMVRRQVKNLRNLIEDLLDVSRISRDKVQLRKERLIADRIFTEAINTIMPSAEERSHTILTYLPAEPLPILADSTRLEQILVNLMNNAIKYTPPGGELFFSAERNAANVLFTIRDNGIGIAEDKLARIFEPFFQLDTAGKASRDGLGIGLAVVRKLVELHGGSISAASDGENKGSAFFVELPLFI